METTIATVEPPKGAAADPINNVVWVDAKSLNPNAWNPNRVMTPELVLLERSMLSLGWLQPVLANRSGVIIDGFHRWRLSQDSPAVRQRWKGLVPVVFLDVDDATAMAITVRINRAKGVHTAIEMSKLASRIVKEFGWTPEELATEIGATIEEVELLLQENVFRVRNIDQWAYSKAWYPVRPDTPLGKIAAQQAENQHLGEDDEA